MSAKAWIFIQTFLYTFNAITMPPLVSSSFYCFVNKKQGVRYAYIMSHSIRKEVAGVLISFVIISNQQTI